MADLRTGAAPGLMALSQRFESFAQRKLAEATQTAKEESFAAGREAFVEGEEPEFQEEKFIGGVKSKAFNEGLRHQYMASLSNDIRSDLSRIEQDHGQDVAGFDTAIQGLRGALGETDPSVKLDVLEAFDRQTSSLRDRVQKRQAVAIRASQQETAERHITDVSEAVSINSRSGDSRIAADGIIEYDNALQSMIQAELITPEQAADSAEKVRRESTSQTIMGNLERISDQNIDQAYEELDNLPTKPPENFTQEEWDKFRVEAQTNLNRKKARLKDDAKRLKSEIDLNNSIQRGSLFTSPDIPANPAKSSQDRKDVNNYYEAVSPAWAGNVNDLINKNVEFVENTGIVPDQLLSNMNASMRSGNPDHVLGMMEVMQRTQESVPQALQDISSETRAIALQVSDSMRNGLPPEEAIEAARKNTFGMSETQKAEIRMASTQSGLKDRIKTFEGMVSDKFDPGFIFGDGRLFPGEPDIPPGMQAAYVSNFEDMMAITNGSVEQSEHLAFQAIQNVWGVSDTGGPRRFTQYPVESFYHVEGFDDAWIEDQFLGDMEASGIEGAILGVDSNVPRSDAPSFPILAPNERGILDIARDEDGNQLRFQPDFEQTKEFIDITSAPDKALETAKQKRERDLENRAGVIRRRLTASVFNYSPGLAQIPRAERAAHLESEEGKESVRIAINNMLAGNKMDFLEAKEALAAFEAGDLEDLPAFDVLVKKGVIRAPD